jgi:threonyl-tRNA synthetase
MGGAAQAVPSGEHFVARGLAKSPRSSYLHAMSSEKVTLREILADQMVKDPTIVGAKVDGKIVDVHTPFVRAEGTTVTPVRSSDADGLRILRHSAAHVMADAVQRLFPGTKVTFGPATANGFFYDFDKPGGPFTDDDLARIEEAMRAIIKKGLPFRREAISREAARELFAGMGETYKREHVDHIPEGEEIDLYRHGSTEGEWLDLCEGPHVPTTRHLGAVKLVSVAGAYWRGDERNPMLQRIYGTAFPTQKALDAHMKLLEEAKARDHRKLGKELELFMFHEYAPAMPFFLPKGAAVYNGMVGFMRGLYGEQGYEEVVTPQIFDKRLFEQSGHWQNYVDNMYLGVTADRVTDLFEADPEKGAAAIAGAFRQGGAQAVMGLLNAVGQKPMNCPSHCLIFGHRRRSYRELPWRVADFGRLHRYERGGVVHGLARVRTFCQDDAHIFCAEDQLRSEIGSFIRLFYGVYRAFGFETIDIKLATRPEKRIGDDALWDRAEKALADALGDHGLAYELSPGEGAFYGPKYEFHVQDALGRSWQLGTLQLDYALPERFGLEYTGADGAPHRPVMLHRAVFGSLERFLAIYIEHTAGAFPVWLAPEQAVVITVSEKQNAYAESVVALLAQKGLRARADTSNDKLGAKKRNARLMRVPYIVVVGDREAQERTVAPWSREQNADLGAMLLDDFAARLVAEAVPPRLASPAPTHPATPETPAS